MFQNRYTYPHPKAYIRSKKIMKCATIMVLMGLTFSCSKEPALNKSINHLKSSRGCYSPTMTDQIEWPSITFTVPYEVVSINALMDCMAIEGRFQSGCLPNQTTTSVEVYMLDVYDFTSTPVPTVHIKTQLHHKFKPNCFLIKRVFEKNCDLTTPRVDLQSTGYDSCFIHVGDLPGMQDTTITYVF